MWWLKEYAHLGLPALASVLTLSSTWILLGPVLNRSGDNIYHLLNEFAIAHAIAAGDNPLGPVGMEFGQPLLRFYQSLFYLYNVGMHFLTGVSLKFLHNVPIVVCFALSPFSYFYFLRKLGLNRWAAAIGAFVSQISIAAFGNSFEAYHQAGIVTQSMGGLFFPWFMGHFIGMLRGENRASTTALLFALAFLSHAIMSVFAVFSGALYVAVTPIKIRAATKKLTVFGLLGCALVAFWVFPFLAHTYEKRPVPDSIIRGAGVHWFTSVSKSELAMVLTTGRLFDDPPRKNKDRDSNDKLMDRISIIGTLKPRPPVLSVMIGLGVLVSLLQFRRLSRRFLLAGFFFSLMLFAGPDDFRWLRHLPFMKQIQTFRCIYLAEFFAFGLVGVGLDTSFRFLGKYMGTRKRFLRHPFFALRAILAIGLFGWVGTEIVLLGQTHLVIRKQDNLNAMADAMSTLDNRGYPFRMAAIYDGRYKIRHAWFSVHGYQPYCTHWKGTGPSSAMHLCGALGGAAKHSDLHALAGARFYSGHKRKISNIFEKKDGDKDPVMTRIANGKDRNGRSNSWHYLLDNGRHRFLRFLVGRPLPVVCNHAQWVWLAKSWTRRYRSWLWEETTPIFMRVRAGEFEKSGLMDAADAVVYLDHSKLDMDRQALDRFVAAGGTLISPVPIPNVETVDPKSEKTLWDVLPASMQRPPEAKGEKIHREEQDPGFENAWVERQKSPTRRFQKFVFNVDVLEPMIAVLPMETVPGWHAALDGKPLPAFATGPDLLGVHLPKGAHQLVFYWEMPRWHKLTVWISLLALAIVIGIWMKRGLSLMSFIGRTRQRGIRPHTT
ncbi:MAG: hypothetical protein QNJ97_21005 [Myxococcota bacterium]|nr:hypothetical protein [Myxococcota bacterium]